jgi:hypothetical protein
VGSDEKQGSDQQHTEERDEMEDLDVAQQQAEDVKGGLREAPGVRRKLDP